MTPTRRDPAVFPVVEPSQAGEVRRAAERMADVLGFGDVRRGEAAIVATELATNLARHATGGEVVLRSLPPAGPDSGPGLELLAIDRGPGIANVRDAIRDGYSTGGTAGTGLGAVRRLSAAFDVFTSVPTGTVLLSRLYAQPARATDVPATTSGAAVEVGAICLPKRGEYACGDAWHVEATGDGRIMVLVADGLGHGLHAADASRRAVELFRANVGHDTARVVELLHAGLRATRGAAVAVAELRPGLGEVRFTGVGNISAAVLDGVGGSRSLLSHNGTAGAEARRIQAFTYPWPRDALLVMHSDGLGSQWQLGKYPGLRFKHPAVVAGTLYRDFRRERDDVTVLVIGTNGVGGVGRP